MTSGRHRRRRRRRGRGGAGREPGQFTHETVPEHTVTHEEDFEDAGGGEPAQAGSAPPPQQRHQPGQGTRSQDIGTRATANIAGAGVDAEADGAIGANARISVSKAVPSAANSAASNSAVRHLK